MDTVRISIKSQKIEDQNSTEEYYKSQKNTLEGINSRLDDKEEQISKQEDRVVEIAQGKQKKKTSGTISSMLTSTLQGSQKERRKRKRLRTYLKK